MTSSDLVASFKKQPVGFICGGLIVVLGVLIYLQTGTTEASQTEYETKSTEAAKIIANVNASKNLAEHVQEVQAQVKDLESRYVRAGQLAVNLQYFYKLEAENNVKLLDVRQGAAPRKGPLEYDGIPFNVTVQGPYKQVMIFLNRLENGPHFCRFNGANFTKVVGDSSAQSTMTLSLNLELLGQL